MVFLLTCWLSLVSLHLCSERDGQAEVTRVTYMHTFLILKNKIKNNDLILRLFLEVFCKHGVEVLTTSCEVRTMHNKLRITHQSLLP